MNAPAFALIGPTHPSDAFPMLHSASQAARAARRPTAMRHEKRWRYGGEPIALPVRLPT